ncbi:orotate phosphoribosyltransferase [Paracrocinitomix mangrovi]|uniref:orotate phosphoribosyltransferase n=1 Tax=Paracrocinitomix mangrovi TaxID=2862509 RepID=UPI001C8E85A0|nr:orotate phosphoribosyltransferase [Paracrocinitomix mangrovi]UKN01697.1 orotate phosphoribosyltransferase [Paracrocinitomix mangrovi]
MILNKDKALKIADFLLQIKAVKLQPSEPFTWASGMKSPIYCDNRKTLSFPQIRTAIRQTFAEQITEHFSNIEVIAGVATGGIAIGALVAEELGLPFIYVRSSAKAHGLGNQIEGEYQEGQRVVVIEDLISTGGSSLKAVEALRDGGINVLGLAAIFTYGFEIADKNFAAANCEYITLSDYDHLLEQADKANYIPSNEIDSLKKWKVDPENWNK